MILRNILKTISRPSSSSCSYTSIGCSEITFMKTNAISYKVFTRTLYSAYLLGIEGFRNQNEQVRKATFYQADTFEDAMFKSIADNESVIFTGDVKNLIALCETKPQLLDLTVQSIKKYYSYAGNMNMQPYQFGPFILRLLYCLNDPETAIKIFQQKDLKPVFKQAVSYQIIMDMMFDSQHYEKVVDLVNEIVDNNLFPIPQSCLSLALAANCKIRTKGSLEHSFHLLRKQSAIEKSPTFRALAFAAYHCLSLGQISEAMDIISRSSSKNHFLIYNIELILKCRLGRMPEVLDDLRTRALIDTPKMSKHSVRVIICKDVLNEVEKIIVDKVMSDISGNNESMIYIFNKLKVILESSKLISNQTLEEAVFSPIDIPEKVRLNLEIKKLKSSPILRPVSKWE